MGNEMEARLCTGLPILRWDVAGDMCNIGRRPWRSGADPAGHLRGGQPVTGGPNLGYPKTENSTYLTRFFGMDPNSLSKFFFGSFMMPPSWALGGHGRVSPPLDPPVQPVAICAA